MRSALFAFVTGLLFGAGLLVSGMANPEKVLGFLDLAGAWDPSLALVMAGAIGVAWPGFRLIRGRSLSRLGLPMQWPTSNRIDHALLAGALLFGAGWGMAGFCPGPAIVALGAGVPKALVFVSAMLAGMALFRFLNDHRAPHNAA